MIFSNPAFSSSAGPRVAIIAAMLSTSMTAGRRTAWVLAMLILIATGVLGLNNARREIFDARGFWQHSVQLAGAFYGMCGVFAGIGLARRRQWSVRVAAAWGVFAVWAATVASFAYTPEVPPAALVSGTVGAFVGSATLVTLVIWATRVTTRRANLPDVAATAHIPRS